MRFDACSLRVYHDDVMTWKCFPSYWPFMRGIHWPLLDSPHKGPVMGSFDEFFAVGCEQTVELLVSWNAMTLMLRHCNVVGLVPRYLLPPKKAVKLNRSLTHWLGLCKKNVTPLLTHWSYVFLALTHRRDVLFTIIACTQQWMTSSDNRVAPGQCQSCGNSLPPICEHIWTTSYPSCVSKTQGTCTHQVSDSGLYDSRVLL